VVCGSPLDELPHLARLARSLAELRIPAPTSDAALREVIRRVRDGIVYVQITRGVAARPRLPKVCEARPCGNIASEEAC
jgi:branched-subunit amino acid aminotransferase/4-amino-4-deoxychorismate lyase